VGTGQRVAAQVERAVLYKILSLTLFK